MRPTPARLPSAAGAIPAREERGAAGGEAAGAPPPAPRARRHVRRGAARARLLAPPERSKGFALFLLACVVLGALGYALRDERFLDPGDGAGYWLGIGGLTLLVLQLAYSVRKRTRWVGTSALRPWYQTHIVLGLLGPLAILFHANFRVGAVNSAIALGAMLVVTASGLIGRFLHRRVHEAALSQRIELGWLERDLRVERDALADLLAEAPELAALTRSFDAETLASPPGVARFALAGLRARRLRRACRRALAQPRGAPRLAAELTLRALDAYLETAVRLVRFSAFERWFRLWHPLHVPLCLVLFLAAAIHVVAVHWY